MNIREVTYSGLVGLRDGRLALPEKGVVLVTGENGQGKSSIIDAIAFGLYGESPRGMTPFSADAANGEISVLLADGTTARRRAKRRGTKTGMDFSWGATQYESPSIAQEAFSAKYGAYEHWERAAILTPASVIAFTGAQDAQRKALVESILRLPDFSKAAAAVSRDKGQAVASSAAKDQAIVSLSQERDRLEQQLKDSPIEATARAAAVRAMEAAKLSQANAQGAKAALEAIRQRRQEVETEERVLAGALQAERGRAAMIHDRCPTCGSALEVAAARAAAEALIAQAATKYAARRVWGAQDRAEEEAAERRYQADVLKYQADKAAFDDAKALLAAAEQLVPTRLRLAEIVEALPKLQAEADAASREAKTLDRYGEAFGLRGIRTGVLEDSLRLLTEGTNLWLARVTTDFSVDISLSSGRGTTERITILRRGDLAPYRAFSAGQKRLVDLAVMFALGEITAATTGVSAGTLMLDECLDALSSTHVAKMCEVVSILAENRCVVLITHSTEAERMLSPALHLRMKNGAPA